MSGLEIVGVIFGLVCVWLTAKNNVWSWPIGIVNIGAFIVMFYQNGLYADVCLHVAYLILSIYGWFHWGQTKNDLPVTRIDEVEKMTLPIVIPVSAVVVGYLFSTYTHAAAPYVDSMILVLSLSAQWLMAKKVLESWLIWIVVDVIGIGLYSYKGLYLTGFLYFLYLIICIIGLRKWKQNLLV